MHAHCMAALNPQQHDHHRWMRACLYGAQCCMHGGLRLGLARRRATAAPALLPASRTGHSKDSSGRPPHGQGHPRSVRFRRARFTACWRPAFSLRRRREGCRHVDHRCVATCACLVGSRAVRGARCADGGAAAARGLLHRLPLQVEGRRTQCGCHGDVARRMRSHLRPPLCYRRLVVILTEGVSVHPKGRRVMHALVQRRGCAARASHESSTMRRPGKSGQSSVNVSYSPPSPQMLHPNCLPQVFAGERRPRLSPIALPKPSACMQAARPGSGAPRRQAQAVTQRRTCCPPAQCCSHPQRARRMPAQALLAHLHSRCSSARTAASGRPRWRPGSRPSAATLTSTASRPPASMPSSSAACGWCHRYASETRPSRAHTCGAGLGYDTLGGSRCGRGLHHGRPAGVAAPPAQRAIGDSIAVAVGTPQC